MLVHNPNITSLLATPDELVKLGEYVADHVNQCLVQAVGLPLDGLDNYFKEGSQWHGVDVTPLFEAIRSTSTPRSRSSRCTTTSTTRSSRTRSSTSS